MGTVADRYSKTKATIVVWLGVFRRGTRERDRNQRLARKTARMSNRSSRLSSVSTGSERIEGSEEWREREKEMETFARKFDSSV
jgi:hypothetical protein